MRSVIVSSGWVSCKPNHETPLLVLGDHDENVFLGDMIVFARDSPPNAKNATLDTWTAHGRTLSRNVDKRGGIAAYYEDVWIDATLLTRIRKYQVAASMGFLVIPRYAWTGIRAACFGASATHSESANLECKVDLELIIQDKPLDEQVVFTSGEPIKVSAEPECTCKSLLWGHEFGCHLYKR